jgi:hypothetical protein
MFARLRSGVKAAPPAPLIDVNRAPDAPRDRADVNIAEIDVPAVLAFGVSAAGKFGHGLSKRTAGPRATAHMRPGMGVPLPSRYAFSWFERGYASSTYRCLEDFQPGLIADSDAVPPFAKD